MLPEETIEAAAQRELAEELSLEADSTWREMLAVEDPERPTSGSGVYAVQPNWPDEGHWVLKLTTNRDDSPVTLIAELGPNGGLGEESFFGRRSTSLALSSIRVVTGPVSADRVDTALRAMAGGAD